MQKIGGVLKLRWGAEHRTHAAGFARDPKQKQDAHGQHKWRADAFKNLDGLDTAPDHGHVQRPESQKAYPLKIGCAGPDDLEHGINRLTADPGLNTKPAAGD